MPEGHPHSDVTSDDSPLTRRAYLRAAGATVGVAALAGCGEQGPGTTTTARSTWSPAETSTRPPTETTTQSPTETTTQSPTETETQTATGAVDESQYETVVNVADAADAPTDEKPVNPVLEEHVGDDTLLYFPPGRYRVDPWKATGYRNLGVVGENAVLVPPTGVNYWLQWGDLREFRFAGFEIDCRKKKVSPVTYLSVSGGTNVVRDVTVKGHRRGPRTAFEIAAADPNAELLFENVSLPDGATNGHAVYAFPRSVGRLTFRNCRVEHWAEALYVAYHSGPLRIIGGYYANNGIQQVRVGGGKSGALVRGVTIRVDNPRRAQHKPNMRGIWAEEGARVRIENCNVALTDITGTYSSGAIVVGKQFGEAHIENTRIRTDVKSNAISVRNPVDSMKNQTIPSMGSLPESWRVTCRNVRITGSSGRGTAVRVNRRDDCLFEGLCIQHPKGSRDGVSVSHADGSIIRDSIIDVGGDAVATESATVVTNGLRTNGSC